MDWSLFKRAVADTEEPISGYMYREMAQWTFKDYNTQMKFIEALLKKLKPSSTAHVLFKVLRIIKVVCETGHSDFQREMQANHRAEEVKAFVKYNGLPDQRHGDALNEKVRQAAREALEVIFSHRREEPLNIGAGYGNNTSGNNGSDTVKPLFSTGHSVTTSLAGGSAMPFGGNVAPMPARNKWAEHMAEEASKAQTSTAGRVLSAIAEKAKNIYPMGSSTGFKSSKDILYETAMKLGTTGGDSSAMFGNASGSSSYSPSAFPVGFQQTEAETSTAPFFAETNANSGGSGWKFIESMGPSNQVTTPAPTAQPQQLTLFQSIAQRISQMKTTPQRVELRTFLAQCREAGAVSQSAHGYAYNNDGESETDLWDELAEALDAQLGQCYSWQQRLNALVAIEALLSTRETGDAAMRNGVTRYFRENPEDIQRNVLVVQSTLRERAQRVLRLLGLPERGDKSTDISEAASSSAQEVQSAGNGSNMFLPTAHPQQQEPKQQLPQTKRSEVDFRGMSVRTTRQTSRDAHTLKKRAPMRLATEEQQREENEGEMGVGLVTHTPFQIPSAHVFASGDNNGHINTAHSSGKRNDKNVFDDLFDSSSEPPQSHGHPPSSTHPAERTANEQLTSSFDFLSIASGSNVTRTPAPVVKENSLRESPETCAPAPAPLPPDNFSPLAVMQMQQQLEVLMNNLQQSPKPTAVAQLQQLMLQQQQLLALVTQQQKAPGGAAGRNEVPSHQHFTTGAASHATGSNAFAEVQQEMLSRMSGSQKNEE